MNLSNVIFIMLVVLIRDVDSIVTKFKFELGDASALCVCVCEAEENGEEGRKAEGERAVTALAIQPDVKCVGSGQFRRGGPPKLCAPRTG